MQSKKEKDFGKAVVKVSRYTVYISMVPVVCIVIIVISLFINRAGPAASTQAKESDTVSCVSLPSAGFAGTLPNTISGDDWKPPNEKTIPGGKEGDMIRYGKELLANTAIYLGPKGTIAQLTNGMNCQNCHLNGGTKFYANNYASFISSYPKLSWRSGKVEPATERIAECFERSLNGSMPDSSTKEIQSILAYMKWVGQDVKTGQQLFGNGTEKLAFMDKAADPVAGQEVYIEKCQSCHGRNGDGVMAAGQKSYAYPPLWGKHSYNDGAGMYRLTNLAGFVKNNMPFGATYQNPRLTDEEAWNVAAFVNSQPRPHRDQHNDWKDLKKKPIDFPFGPYADNFNENQHKLGPYNPIKDAHMGITLKSTNNRNMKGSH